MTSQIEHLEFQLLVQTLYEKYGFDFRGYSEASLKRRIRAILTKYAIPHISALQSDLLSNPETFKLILPNLTVSTTEMFRDPVFYKYFREQIVPVLQTFPTLKIWHAGCSTGEEIYSIAIILQEAGLLENSVIYATDINPDSLRKAKEGIYPVELVKKFTENYITSGGRESFSSYYSTAYGACRFDPKLCRNVVFSTHNLVIDEVFSEMNVILCRNVMIYFKKTLQNRVLDLFSRSLIYKGYLCMGTKETLKFMDGAEQFKQLPDDVRIFRKVSRSPGMRELEP